MIFPYNDYRTYDIINTNNKDFNYLKEVEELLKNADSGVTLPVNINNKSCLEALNLILTENMIP
jgi:hypothetical protein